MSDNKPRPPNPAATVNLDAPDAANALEAALDALMAAANLEPERVQHIQITNGRFRAFGTDRSTRSIPIAPFRPETEEA